MIPMQQMTDINTSFDLVIRMVGYNMLLSGATIIIVFLRTEKRALNSKVVLSRSAHAPRTQKAPHSPNGRHHPRVCSKSFSSICRMSSPFIASPSSSEAASTFFAS